MKQKKTQIIFYFFLLTILSFSSHAAVTTSPEFIIGSSQLGDESAELSTLPDRISRDPSCPRPMINEYDEDEHERNCMAAYRQCINGCLNAIGRGESDASTSARERDCYFRCDERYKSCVSL